MKQMVKPSGKQKSKPKNSFWSCVRFSVGTMWKLDPKFKTLEIAVRIIEGLIPSIIVYVEALILYQLSRISTIETFYACVGIIAVDYVLNLLGSGGIYMFYGRYSAYKNAIIGRKLNKIGQDRVMKMDLRCFFDDDFNIIDNVSDIGAIGSFYEMLLNTIESLTTLVSSIVLLISIEPFFVLFVLIFALPSFYASNKIAAIREKMKERVSLVSQHSGEMKKNVLKRGDESRIFDFSDFFLDMWNRDRRVILKNRLFVWLYNAFFSLLVSILSNLGGILCIAVIVYKCVNGSSGITDAALAITVMNSVQGAISNTSFRYNNMVGQLADMERYMKFAYSDKYMEPSGDEKIDEIREIRLENVSFSYKNDGKFALKNVNLTINSGEYAAFVGRNGSGKTTLIKLICGLYTPTSGTIYYNGIPHTKVDRESLYRRFSSLFQNYGTYNLNLRDNIVFGGEYDENRLVETGKYAGIEEILPDCPAGYDTMLGEYYGEGVDISRGQWQRVAAARAFYRHTDVLMMDEPSSAIDPITERGMYEALRDYGDASIRLVVSHRMSYMRETSRIIMLEDGEIIEDGTFDELKANEGAFRKLYDIQSRRYTNLKIEEEM
ncbi:MAG: ABC transporter ATP-binding protein/permease [Clostridiales bacterium]|nr:ABC transporter ATP-binding protein/permease [Clostridiales bacterium]